MTIIPFTSYAQNMEDYHLHLTFGGKTGGTYIDIGGGHPVACVPTRAVGLPRELVVLADLVDVHVAEFGTEGRLRVELHALAVRPGFEDALAPEKLDKLLRQPERYIWRADGLAIVFNQYEVAAYVMGRYVAHVPYGRLAPLMRPDAPIGK